MRANELRDSCGVEPPHNLELSKILTRELSRAPLDGCSLEFKGCEDCEGQLVSDENDTKIIDAAAHNPQEKEMDKATSARMRGGWAERNTPEFLIPHPGGAKVLPPQMGIRITQHPTASSTNRVGGGRTRGWSDCSHRISFPQAGHFSSRRFRFASSRDNIFSWNLPSNLRIKASVRRFPGLPVLTDCPGKMP